MKHKRIVIFTLTVCMQSKQQDRSNSKVSQPADCGTTNHIHSHIPPILPTPTPTPTQISERSSRFTSRALLHASDASIYTPTHKHTLDFSTYVHKTTHPRTIHTHMHTYTHTFDLAHIHNTHTHAHLLLQLTQTTAGIFKAGFSFSSCGTLHEFYEQHQLPVRHLITVCWIYSQTAYCSVPSLYLYSCSVLRIF
jgi:hypothetical protein